MSTEEASSNQEDNVKRYLAIPKYKNSFIEEGEYTKDLDSGKRATILCDTNWRWGECVIEITEEERKAIIKMEEVCLTDYICEFCESTDGWNGDRKLKDADSYTKEDKQEIMESLRNHSDDSDDDDDDDNSGSDEDDKPDSSIKREDFNVDELHEHVEDCDPDYMEENGEWSLDETHYYIIGGCVLVPDGANLEDYAQGDGSYANKEEPDDKVLEPEVQMDHAFKFIDQEAEAVEAVSAE